jgi:hypothetical protein
VLLRSGRRSARPRLQQAIGTPDGVYAGADRVASGVVGSKAIPLKAGNYDVPVGDRRLQVTVQADSASLLDLQAR